jgi:hypothetical protein
MQVSPVTMSRPSQRTTAPPCLPLGIKGLLKEDARLFAFWVKGAFGFWMKGGFWCGRLLEGKRIAEGKRLLKGKRIAKRELLKRG